VVSDSLVQLEPPVYAERPRLPQELMFEGPIPNDQQTNIRGETCHGLEQHEESLLRYQATDVPNNVLWFSAARRLLERGGIDAQLW
jgi:hypothetical protein